MSDRRRSCHSQPQRQQQQHSRATFEDKCRALDAELRRQTETIDELR